MSSKVVDPTGGADLLTPGRGARRRPSRSTSSGPTLSCALPKRSTHSTSATSPSGSLAGHRDDAGHELGRVDRLAQLVPGRRRCRGGRPPARTGRGRRTSPLARAGGRRGWSARRPGPAPPAMATAGARRPLSGPTSTPSPSATSTAIARRSVPTPGSTTASTTPDGTYWMHRARASEPARMSWGGISWVRSMTVTWRARSRMTALTTPDELVGSCRSRTGRSRCRSGRPRAWSPAHPNDGTHRWNGRAAVVHFVAPEGE